MLEALLEGFIQLAEPFRLAMLGLGVLIGLAVGIIPGIGGTVGFALVLPFLMHFDPTAAIAMLIGLVAITTTSDTITCVLFAIPGTGGSVATIIDGHAMARKGEAGEALAAAFLASAIGGVFGAVILAMSIPVARPLVLQFGSPEFFMLSILGISMVAVLSGRRPLKGLMAAGLGLLLATVGGAPTVCIFRYYFGIPYLYDGIPLVLIALGVFALPEIIDLVIRKMPVAGAFRLGKGAAMTGMRHVLKEIPLVLRCAGLGTYIGFVPGMGTSVANWIGYGHSVQSAKDKSGFGHGDIRGVIGPESANNAARGGELIPTLLFGVPGSGSMALFLMGLMMFNLRPGTDMITVHLPLTFTIVWSLLIANVVGAVICMFLARQLAWFTTIPIHVLAPFLMMVVITAAFQASRDWGDLILLLLLTLVGWSFKQFGFSRPAFIVGFVLGGIAEVYLWISVQRYGMAWLLHPWVIGIILLMIASVIVSIIWQRKGQHPVDEGGG